MITAARSGRSVGTVGPLRQVPKNSAESSSAEQDRPEAGNEIAWLVPICRLNSTAVSSGWVGSQAQGLLADDHAVRRAPDVDGRGQQHVAVFAREQPGRSPRPARRSPSCSFRGRFRNRSSFASRPLQDPRFRSGQYKIDESRDPPRDPPVRRS